MNPVKNEVMDALNQSFIHPPLILNGKEKDELATVILQSTLNVFNVLRKVGAGQREAKKVMDMGKDIVVEAIGRRKRRPSCYKVSWDAF